MLPLDATRLDVEEEVVGGCRKELELWNREVEEVEGMIWVEEEELKGAKEGEEVEEGKGLEDFFKEAAEELRSRLEAFTVLIIDSSRDLMLS
jgi:C4-type Zn-finger protein